MVLSPAIRKFSRPSMSQQVHTIADSAGQNFVRKDNGFVETANDHTVDPASVNCSHSNGSPKKKNLPRDSFTFDLHAQGNGEANQGGEVDKYSSGAPHEASKSSDENEKEENYVDKPNLHDSPVKPVPCEDSGSDAMEQDVKVCDICGDTGREDLLAACSRCTDGAEHTYCMQEMLQKVPEDDWLCEECKFPEEIAAQKYGLGSKGKNLGKAMQLLGKRPIEDISVACIMKKLALDVAAGSPRMGNGIAASSRNSSLNMEKGKGRPYHEVSEIPRSSNASRFQVFKNTLSKSKSFSALIAKLKVKQVEEGFLQKPRGTRPHSLLDAKIGSLRTLRRSASFKYVNGGRPDSPNSTVKLYQAKFSNIQELKGGSREKNEQNPADRNRLDQDPSAATGCSSTSYTTKFDQKLPSQCETHSLSSVTDSRDSNIVQSNGKPGYSLSKSASYVGRATDGTVGSAGSSSSDGGCNIKRRSNYVVPKSGMLLGLSRSSERPYNSGTGNGQDGLACARKSRNHVEIAHECYSSCLVTSGSRIALCEKCDESGNTAELCSRGSSRACDIDVSVAIVSRDTNYVAHASTQERSTFRDIYKKSEIMTQLNGLNEATRSLKAGASESKWMPLLGELPALCNASIIPEHDCIWQGGFQVQRGSKQIDLQGGFQAHLPTHVSPMVLEMVSKFPDKIALNEVSRVSIWPVQFRIYGTKEDHIALYFFAQDLESHERHYNGLLENMMKSDLALKGDLGTAELLIFPSDQLPKKSQCWNMLFYLWGIFKGSQKNGLYHGVGERESPRKKKEADTSGCNRSRDTSMLRDGFARQVVISTTVQLLKRIQEVKTLVMG